MVIRCPFNDPQYYGPSRTAPTPVSLENHKRHRLELYVDPVIWTWAAIHPNVSSTRGRAHPVSLEDNQTDVVDTVCTGVDTDMGIQTMGCSEVTLQNISNERELGVNG